MKESLKVAFRRVPFEKKKRLVFSGVKSDARLLLGVFNTDLLRELERRGYDLRTLKFEIKPAGERHMPLPDDCI